MKKELKTLLFGFIIAISLLGYKMKGQVNCTSTVSTCNFKSQVPFTNSDSKQTYNAIMSLNTGTGSAGSGSVVVTNTVNITGSVTVLNPVTSVTVANSPSVTVTNTVIVTGTLTASTNTSNVTVYTDVVTVSASTFANNSFISFYTSGTFSGTINGAVIGPNTSMTFPVIQYRTYPAISYVITTGNITVIQIK